MFVGMSGGVDSSVAAYLLKKQGYDVTGVFIRSYNVDGCAERDAEDARRVAEHLRIPFYVFDFEKEYKESVVDYMVSTYRDGITPNPDVMCNKEIKFGLFLKKALALGADYIATGHYVRLGRIISQKQHNFLPARKFASPSSRHPSLRSETKLSGLRDVPRDNSASPSFSLFEAEDKNKDQSYFLWTLTQEQLKHCLFPIGDYLKPQVREIARKAGISTAEKKDSQGICFLGEVDLTDFLKQYLPEKPGEIVTTDGAVVGRHEGIFFYTIGQRHLGVDLKVRNPDHKPYYVAAKDLAKNELIVAEGDDHPALFKQDMELRQVNFIDKKLPSLIRANRRIEVLARVRYRQPLIRATLIYADKGRIDTDIDSHKSVSRSASIRVTFAKPVKFVAPGQSAVFYSQSGEMLGGGVIS